jgi:predicted transcriptional regulator
MSALTLRIPANLDQDVRELAERQHITRSDFARRALEFYVKKTQQDLALKSMIEAARAIHKSEDLRQHIIDLSKDFSSTEGDMALSFSKDDKDNNWWK